VEPPDSPPEGDTAAEHEDGNDVDEEILDELFVLLDDGTPDGLIQACDLFLVGVPTALADIRSALAGGLSPGESLDDAGRIAHTLRGTAGAFGAARLGRLAARLEEACRRSDALGSSASAGALVDGMEAEFVAFRAILTARLAAATPS